MTYTSLMQDSAGSGIAAAILTWLVLCSGNMRPNNKVHPF